PSRRPPLFRPNPDLEARPCRRAPRGAKILVVEDDAGTAETLLCGLRQEGYTCEHVADGRDALYLASAAQFDAIVMDRMLPGMDGLSVVKALRAADIHTPLLILSALGQLDERATGLRAGGH